MIRNYKHGDHEEIAKIFPQAIHEIASEYYTEEQCLAWSEKEPNPTHWEKRCAKKETICLSYQRNRCWFHRTWPRWTHRLPLRAPKRKKKRHRILPHSTCYG